MTSGYLPHDSAETPRLRSLRPGELLGIAAFWAFLAILTAAGRVLDPRAIDANQAITRGFVALAFIEYSLWAILTVPIYLAVSRLNRLDHTRTRRVISLVLLGIVIAICVDAALRAFRNQLLPPPPSGRRGSELQNILRFEFLDDFLVYIAIVGAALARDYFVQSQTHLLQTRELQGQLAEARLTALRTQINPHFLFNTLNAMSSLVESDPRGVRRMISRLGDLLRHTLEETTEPEIPLEREVGLLRRYLEIMEVRFQGGLTSTVAIPRDCSNALVPNMILQPLAENAFKHGLSVLESNAKLEVSARLDRDRLILTVTDNGPNPIEAKSGVGIANTRARLSNLYGDAATFSLRARTDGPGAVAEVTLPYHELPLRA
jgi:signal transduction histidine kinase